jgi:hypothetical protein
LDRGDPSIAAPRIDIRPPRETETDLPAAAADVLDNTSIGVDTTAARWDPNMDVIGNKFHENFRKIKMGKARVGGTYFYRRRPISGPAGGLKGPFRKRRLHVSH